MLTGSDEPVTGKEVGDTLGISNRSALDKLNELHDREMVERKKVGAGAVEVSVGLRRESAQYWDRFNEVVEALVVLPITETTARRAISIQHNLLDRGNGLERVTS